MNLDDLSAETLGSSSSQPTLCSRLISPRPHHRSTCDTRGTVMFQISGFFSFM